MSPFLAVGLGRTIGGVVLATITPEGTGVFP